MDRLGVVTLRVRRFDLRVVDAVVSAVLVVCAITDARDQLPAGSFGAAAVVCCAVCGGSVAWRRTRPAWACFAAGTGWAALVVITGYDSAGVFEWVAVVLTFYALGRQPTRPGASRGVASVFAYWLLVSPLIVWVPAGGSPGDVVGLWPPELVAYAIGRWFATRRSMIDELAAQAVVLEREQAKRAREAVDEERRGMARELHDVVAHCVSVMVVQTLAARTVAARDEIAARGALSAVERAGREALVELRRIVGVLRYDGDPLADAAMPTLARLPALVDRAAVSGVPVKFHVDGARRDLPAALELVVYRLIQEALTNVIKHSGAASAHVRLRYEERVLGVEVSDSGGGSSAVRDTTGARHGLHGMRERVALYGGEFDAGPLPAGGFAVRARIPYAGLRRRV